MTPTEIEAMTQAELMAESRLAVHLEDLLNAVREEAIKAHRAWPSDTPGELATEVATATLSDSALVGQRIAFTLAMALLTSMTEEAENAS